MTSEIIVAFVVALPGLLTLLIRTAHLDRRIKHLERRILVLEALCAPPSIVD